MCGCGLSADDSNATLSKFWLDKTCWVLWFWIILQHAKPLSFSCMTAQTKTGTLFHLKFVSPCGGGAFTSSLPVWLFRFYGFMNYLQLRWEKEKKFRKGAINTCSLHLFSKHVQPFLCRIPEMWQTGQNWNYRQQDRGKYIKDHAWQIWLEKQLIQSKTCNSTCHTACKAGAQISCKVPKLGVSVWHNMAIIFTVTDLTAGTTAPARANIYKSRLASYLCLQHMR